MERDQPSKSLDEVWGLLLDGKIRETYTALAGAAALGMSKTDMYDVVRGLTSADFRKSMSSHADDTVWQDVYKPATKFGRLYVKLIVSDNVLIVSFKEK
jgi:motility quorum-sensing regulator/GCU-specific mRNA interferase toxin